MPVRQNPESYRACQPKPWLARSRSPASLSGRRLERETGIEPATNSLEGCDSTTELLPPTRRPLRLAALRRVNPPRVSHRSTPLLVLGHSLEIRARKRTPFQLASRPLSSIRASTVGLPAVARTRSGRAKVGGEGRTRTFEAARATDLQSAAFDRFATSPAVCEFWKTRVF